MLSIEALKEFGANTQEGLNRCLNQEEFYLRLVKNAVEGDGFDKLSTALEQNDLDRAFEASHALKGVLANLALTPLFEVCNEMTELLRARTQIDYVPYNEKLQKLREKLKALCEE
ncbi:MAG: Hpt domain-containing protein [Erysipelotrichaceae bacterium]|nr:Hpt domain-containing protein [Erysipelotrichaceae bacterium]